MVRQNKNNVFENYLKGEKLRKESRSRSKSALGVNSDKPNEIKSIKAQKPNLQKQLNQPFLDQLPALMSGKSTQNLKQSNSRKNMMPVTPNMNRERSKTPAVKLNKGKPSLKKLKFTSIAKNPQVA